MNMQIYCMLLCLLTIIDIINPISHRCIVSKLGKRRRMEPYDYTFFAQILLRTKLICSATVIHNCWLLSAASCFDLTPNWSSYEVLVGVIGKEETYTQHPVLQVFIEDNYHRGSNVHNIALIQVDYLENINYLSTISIVSTPMFFDNNVHCMILEYNRDSLSEPREIKMGVANYTNCNYKMNKLRTRRFKPSALGKNNFCLIPIGDHWNETFCGASIGGPVLCSSNEHLRGVVVEFPLNKQCNDIGPIPVIDISMETEWLQDSILNLNKIQFAFRTAPSSANLKCKPFDYFMIFLVFILWNNS